MNMKLRKLQAREKEVQTSTIRRMELRVFLRIIKRKQITEATPRVNEVSVSRFTKNIVEGRNSSGRLSFSKNIHNGKQH